MAQEKNGSRRAAGKLAENNLTILKTLQGASHGQNRGSLACFFRMVDRIEIRAEPVPGQRSQARVRLKAEPACTVEYRPQVPDRALPGADGIECLDPFSTISKDLRPPRSRMRGCG